jgi:hypothetical protein
LHHQFPRRRVAWPGGEGCHSVRNIPLRTNLCVVISPRPARTPSLGCLLVLCCAWRCAVLRCRVRGDMDGGPPLTRVTSNTSSSTFHKDASYVQNRAARSSSSTLPNTVRPIPPTDQSATPTPAAHATSVSASASSPSSSLPPPPPVHPSILQPRVAVVLNVPTKWHPWLFALRLCSILPAVWWGLPSALQLLLRLLPRQPDLVLAVAACGPGRDCELDREAAAARYALTETALGTIWVRLSYIGAWGVASTWEHVDQACARWTTSWHGC